METPARFYLCARCRDQVTICRRCDRGHIYCSRSCASAARQASMREAGRRYQSGRMGRFKHADRTRRYRLRQQNVTHHGSAPPRPDALLVANPAVSRKPAVAQPGDDSGAICCHFCGSRCPDFVRTGFLRHYRAPVQLDRRGTQRGHSP